MLFDGGMMSDRQAPPGPVLRLCTEGVQDAPWVGDPHHVLPLPAAENLSLSSASP